MNNIAGTLISATTKPWNAKMTYSRNPAGLYKLFRLVFFSLDYPSASTATRMFLHSGRVGMRLGSKA